MRKLHYFRLIPFIITLLSFHSSRAAIVLNEMMPCNVSTYMNEYQNYTGWVEVYNDSGSPVNLRGYIFVNEYMKSGLINSQSATITRNVTIPAYGYAVLFFDEEDGDNHVSYKIETEPGSLVLLDNARRKVSELNYQKMYPHVSWGRYGNSEGYMSKPTPNAANEPIISRSNRRVQTPAFGTPPGFYSSSTSVSLQSEEGATVYYTTNGAEPTEQSTKYSTPVAVSRTTVIRARAYKENTVMSEIASGTFIFDRDSKGINHHSSCAESTIPVVSISTTPDNFFGNQFGIYVKGANGIPGGCDKIVANYYQNWKRPINFEYFVDKQRVISQELDAAVMGGCSRDHTQKSLKLTASKKLGNNKIPYDFFPIKLGNEYKSLQLRNGGNDQPNTLIRDGFMQSLIQGMMNVDYQAYQPVAFYINGEYWGLMSMMERTNKDYVYSNYGLSEEEIDLLKPSGNNEHYWYTLYTGTADAYYDMLEQAATGTDSPDYYEKMNRLIDVDEYIDYHIFEQYIGNTDWPGNNIKVWREKNNGRFRWIVYDTDFGFGIYGEYQYKPDFNMLNFCLGQGNYLNWANEKKAVELFQNLMKNETFREKFLNKFINHLGTTFTPVRVNSIKDSIYAEANAEICAHRKKFPGWAGEWPLYISSDFGNQRAENVYNHLMTYYELGSLVNLNISANIPGANFIINGERVNTSKYAGRYYRNKQLEVQPVAPAGYKFVSWNLMSPSATESLLNNNSVWRYYYSWGPPEGNWHENAYNDATWSSGKGKFGYDTNNLRTYDVPLNYGGDPNNKYITAYFRSSFDISDLSAVNELKGNIIYDDGVVMYLNGHEIKRFNMPSGAVSYWTFASNTINDETASFTIDKSYLQEGKNVLAVEVHQVNRTSSDLTFKLDLSLTTSDRTPLDQVQTYYTEDVGGNLNLEAIFEKCDYVKPLLFINELCTSNNSNSGFHNEYGVYGDWIEIYNGGEEPVDLAGMYLTENTKQVTYQFPYNAPFETTVLPDDYKIVWADKSIWQGAMHANFKLTAESASTLILSQMVDGQKVEIDRVSYPKEVGKNKNESYGRVTDGAAQWKLFAYCPEESIYLATPGEANGSRKCGANSVDNTFLSDNSTGMKLYPNPAKTVLNIEVHVANSYIVQIYDDKGCLIEYLSTVSENVTALNLQGYVSGIYIVRVIADDAVWTQKFVKY